MFVFEVCKAIEMLKIPSWKNHSCEMNNLTIERSKTQEWTNVDQLLKSGIIWPGID